jgi:hypothetical protein
MRSEWVCCLQYPWDWCKWREIYIVWSSVSTRVLQQVHEKVRPMRRETATTATQKEQTTPEATRDYLQDGGGTGWLIDNHYMAQAMSDEPIDLGMCKKVHLLSGPTC